MELEDIVKEQLYYLSCSEWVGQGYEVCIFGELIHYNQDGVMSF
jgi:hypothetical protein